MSMDKMELNAACI